MRNSYDVIEIDNYAILSTLQNLRFGEYSNFVCRFGLKHAKPDIGKLFNTNIILSTKYPYLNWNIVKPLTFIQNMNDSK